MCVHFMYNALESAQQQNGKKENRKTTKTETVYKPLFYVYAMPNARLCVTLGGCDYCGFTFNEAWPNLMAFN